ncbi:PQQ-dependent dehydrogenase, methanol/ethanol family [Methylocystis echinoides]|uniref:PQQ-dependent dehydrogenase, methanol/ethanol family n=1 Tax=Methylocystis echinoides TaxID=29468 RepID=UPI003446EA0F
MTPVSSLGRGLRARHICGALLCFLLIPLGVDAAPRKLDAIAADPAQWPMPSKNHASTRYSELDEINAGNVGQLQLAWSFSLNADRGQEAAPLVIDNMIYVIAPYSGPSPNQVFALDATTGVLKWSYAPKPEPAAAGVACCDVVTRGLAYDNGRIFLNTLDNHTVALDAATGAEVWRVKLGDINRGETMTMAPFVAKGKVLVGNSGGEMGVRGWLTALDENTGKIAWRAYTTGPDADVLIGDDFRPFYDWVKGKDRGVTTWPAEKWKIGGGTVWGWISYDPQLNLIFYGTANPGPWNAEQRPGDNLWTATIFARDIDTGAAKWADPIDPHDLFDYDEVNENLLLDLPVKGVERKVLLHVGRNGYMYVIDRATGEIYSADAYDAVNASFGVDLATGRPIENKEKHPAVGRTVKDICPAAPGAKDWQPTAWSPRTKLVYVPHQHLCMDFTAGEVGYLAGTPYVGAKVHMHAGEGGYRGEFLAWDPAARKRVFAIRENFPVWSGALVTAGDVAFYGTMDRLFKAVDARDGKPLWQMRVGSGIIGQPVTYRGADGAQYVAILSGVGGWSGALAAAEIDPAVPYGALGFVGAMQDLPTVTRGGGELLVFRLPPSAAPQRKPPRP